MSSAYEIQIMFMEKLSNHFSTKSEGHSSVIFTPAQDILVRVRPQEVTQEALVRYVRGAHDSSDLLHGLQVWWQTCSQGTHRQAPA